VLIPRKQAAGIPVALCMRDCPGRGKTKKNESQTETGFPAFIDDTATKTGKGRSLHARLRLMMEHLWEISQRWPEIVECFQG
jgi:hypothetical protein